MRDDFDEDVVLAPEEPAVPALSPVPAPAPLNLSPEMLVACARQDIPAAHVAEWRAHVALLGERARRAAIEAEYAKYLQPGPTPNA